MYDQFSLAISLEVCSLVLFLSSVSVELPIQLEAHPILDSSQSDLHVKLTRVVFTDSGIVSADPYATFIKTFAM